jgi:hypothetical protein
MSPTPASSAAPSSPGDFGDCTLTSIDGGRNVRVDRADPRILISGHLVREALAGGIAFLPGCELTSDRLVIDGVNRRVVYRIGRYVPERDWYEAEWPD